MRLHSGEEIVRFRPQLGEYPFRHTAQFCVQGVEFTSKFVSYFLIDRLDRVFEIIAGFVDDVAVISVPIALDLGDKDAAQDARMQRPRASSSVAPSP